MNVELVSSPSPRSGSPISPRIIRRIVIFVFVLGIGGMIAGSIADNNGVAITFGLMTAAAALALVLVTQVSPPGSFAKPGTPVPAVIDEQMAADLEARIERLVADGADETEVRKLVGRAIELGRQQ